MSKMNLIEAFLNATAFAYLAASLYAFLGRPALDGIQANRQGIIYLLPSTIIYLSTKIEISIVYFILGIIYSFATIGSFIGFPQKWMAYWKKDPNEGSDIGQIGMSFWDLALAITFFYLSS